MTILVAGGCGFIGHHLCNILLENNEKLLIVDNISTSDYNIIKNYKQNKNIFLYIGDISKKNFLERYAEELDKNNIEKIDTIYNLTNILNEELYLKNPLKTLDVSYIGTKNLLDLANFYNSQYVHLSSTEIDYISSTGFIEGLRISELLVTEYHKQKNIKTKILRVPEVYGIENSENNANKLIIQLIRNILKNGKIVISENHQSINNCCFVEDVIKELLKETKSTKYLPILLKNSYTYTITELLNLLKEIFNKELDVENHLSTGNQKILSEEKRNSFKENLIKLINYEKERIL